MTEQASLASGNEGNVRDQIKRYYSRIKSGDMGSLPAVFGLLILSTIFQIVSPYFVTRLNFANLFVQASELCILSAGLVFVILIAEIDLAAGTTAGVAMAVFIQLIKTEGWNWILSLIVALLIGIIIGFIIGWIVAKLHVPSFVVSLSFFLAFQGMQLVLLGAGGVYRVEVPQVISIMNGNMPVWAGWILLAVSASYAYAVGIWDRARRSRTGLDNKPILLLHFRLLLIVMIGGASVYYLSLNRSDGSIPIRGVPIVIPIVLLVLVVGTFVLDRTRFGRHIYAVGGNPEAARRAGIKVVQIRVAAFMICGFMAVISGLFHASRIGSVDGSAGHTIVLQGVAAAVVGGVSLFGGRGRLAHAAIGAIVIAMIDNGLGLLQMPAGINYLVQGGVLLLAATIDALARRRNGVVTR